MRTLVKEALLAVNWRSSTPRNPHIRGRGRTAGAMKDRKKKPVDFTPPSDVVVQVAIDLLPTIPKTWINRPDLSHTQEQALGLLVTGGLVELKVPFLLCGVGDKQAVAVRFRFFGRDGLAQALEPALKEAWVLWGEHYQPGNVYVASSGDKQAWRLTEYGEEAAQEIARGEIDYLQDFLRTPGVPGVDKLPPPLTFVPGVSRPVVNGEGYVESVKIINSDSEPVRVEVTNLKDVSTPLENISRAFQEGVLNLTGADKLSGKPRARTRGRKKLSAKEEKRRRRILERWERASESNISRADFCEGEEISVKDLENFQRWQQQRENRA